MPSPVLRVDLLGTPVFSRDGRPVAVDTRKALAVLTLLAVAVAEHSGPIGRDSLAAMFWPEADEARARGGLRRALSVLGAATGDVVETTRTTVALRAEAVRDGAVRSDVVTFRRLAASTEPADLAAAVALVRGDFLAGFAVRDCPPFDDWTAQTAAALRRELDRVLERLVGARVRRGELHTALADALQWLDLDPLHEPAHRAVLRLFAWTGRRQEAVEHYRRCVRVLGDALGVAPVSATTRLYDAIRTDTLAPPPRPETPPAAPAMPPRVPAAPASPAALPMVGRDDALRTLLDEAATTGGRAVLVTGEAGSGRSRLVTEFAACAGDVLVARAHGGEAALSFAPIADLLRAAVARSPGLDPEVALELSRIVPELLPPGRAAAAPLDSPGARDRFYDAIVRGLAGAGARAVAVEDVHAASTASAQVLAYLLHRLDRLGCLLVLSWRDPGLPPRHPVRAALAGGRLAGRITTVALPRLTPAQVAELIAAVVPDASTALDPSAVWTDTAGLPILVVEAIRSGGEALPGSVRDLLAARLAEVSEETAQVLAALAVLGGVADPAVLRPTSGRGDVETVEAVEEAVGSGLVREEGVAVAFTHDALRRVAYEDLSRVRRRLLHTRAAEALVAAGTAADHPGSVARPGVVAHHWHEAGRDDLAAPWAWTAARSAARLFAHEETLLHLDSVVAFGRDDSETALGAGDALVALGRYDEALASFGRAGSLAQGADPVVRARIERRAADVHARRGEWQLADSGLATAGALLADADSGLQVPAGVELRAQVLADRAVVACRAGDQAAAAVHVAEARAIVGSGHPGGRAHVENAAGLVALAADDNLAAVTAFEAALAAGPDVVDRAAVLNNLARALTATGNVDRAVATAREALSFGVVHGDRHRLAALHANLADRLHEAGAQDEARAQQLAAAALFAEVGADPLDRPGIWLLISW